MKCKGHDARTGVDAGSGSIFGEVIGTSDMLTFEGAPVSGALRASRESVDLHPRIRAEQGRESTEADQVDQGGLKTAPGFSDRPRIRLGA